MWKKFWRVTKEDKTFSPDGFHPQRMGEAKTRASRLSTLFHFAYKRIWLESHDVKAIGHHLVNYAASELSPECAFTALCHTTQHKIKLQNFWK